MKKWIVYFDNPDAQPGSQSRLRVGLISRSRMVNILCTFSYSTGEITAILEEGKFDALNNMSFVEHVV